jgi:hypothetical protein
VKTALEETAIPLNCLDIGCGVGLIDASAALEFVRSEQEQP